MHASIAGEFGIVYRARLTRSTLTRTDCEIVAVKTIKGKDMIDHGIHCMSTTGVYLWYVIVSQAILCSESDAFSLVPMCS